MAKKVIALLLTALMLLTMLVPLAFAAQPGTKKAEFNGHTYVLVDESMTWKEAKAYCEEQGGYLATITSQQEQDVIVELIRGAAKHYYWLGATDEEKEGEWKWVTGEEFVFYGPAKTFDNAYGGENYLQIYTNFRGDVSQCGDWNDNNNESYIAKETDFFKTEYTGLICEFGTNEMPSEGSVTVSYNGHTYTAIDQSMTWKEAKKYCEALGGYLATVTSEEEHKVIESAIAGGKKDQYWLGGTDEKKEKDWQWVTGEPFEYWANVVTFDDSHGGEDYLEILTNHFGRKDKFGFWNDANNENYIKEEADFYSLSHVGLILEKGSSEMPVGSKKAPVIYVKGRTPIYKPDGKQAIKTDLSYITDVITKNSGLLVEAMTFGTWNKYCNAIYKGIADKFKDYRLNNDGEVDNDTYVKYSWSEKRLSPAQGDIFTYLYEYDCRVDPCETADDLHAYIEAVKRATGSDTVHIVARCLGCNILTAYFAEYGWDDVETSVFYNSAALGYNYISELFSGRISFNSESLDNFCEQRLDEEDISGDAAREIIKAIINNARTLGLLKYGTNAGEIIFNNVADRLVDRLLLATYATCPGYWSMVNDKYYEDAKEFIFGDEADTTYKKLVEKIDNYHYNVMNNVVDMVDQMDKDGVKINVICKYGLQTPPFVTSSKELSDNTVDVYSQSFFGATCANTGRTLSWAYLKDAKKKGTDIFISPDKMIDSSTAMFPDRTWYIKYYDHSLFFDCFNNMLLDMCYSDGQMTVFSDERYPQYLMYDEQLDDFYPLTEETEDPFEYTNNPLSSFRRLLTSIFDFFRSLFFGKKR